MRLRQTLLAALLGLAALSRADSYVLTSIASSGVTTNSGETMQTTYLSGGGCGFTPTHQVDATSYYYYGPSVIGTYASGSYTFLLWTNQPGGGVSNVQVDFGYVNADGSAYVPEGSASIDVNASGLGNHITTYTFPAIPALVLTNQRLRLRITQGPGSTGAFAIMAYNACTDFDTKLVSPPLAPFGTPTMSPTITLTPTYTLTPVPALNKSVNTTLAIVGQAITYTLAYQNPNPNSPRACQDNFESATTQWPSGWSAPTGGTWATVATDNGPSLPGSSALDVNDPGGYYYSTLTCASPATDGSIQVDVNEMTSSGEFTILWRQNGSSTYQLHVKQGTTSNVELRVTTNGAPNTLAIVSATVPLSGWVTYRFEVIGFTLKGYINGSLVISGTDPNNTFNSGNAGIEIDSGGPPNHVRYDNVIVNNYALDWYNVKLVDTLPAGLSFVSSSCGGTAAGQVVTINLGTLAAAANGSCQIVATTASCPLSLTNSAEIQVGLPAHIEQSNSVHTDVSCSSPTPTSSKTSSPTRTQTSSATPTPSPTFSPSSTPTSSPTATPTASPTQTPTASPTRTPTWSPTATPSFTESLTPSFSPTVTPTSTQTSSSTATPTPSATPSVTFSFSPSPTFSVTGTNTPTLTASPTSSATLTSSPTASSTATPTLTATPSITFSFSPSPTPSLTATPTASPTSSPTFSATPTPSATATDSPSFSPSPTASVTPTNSPSPSASASPTPSGTHTQSFTATSTLTASPSATPSFSDSPTPSQTPSVSDSPTASPTAVPVPFHISVGIYNSAGEKVRTLYAGSAQTSGLEAKLSANSLLGGQSVLLLFGGQLGSGSSSLPWSGDNDQGQYVSAGIYYMRVESVDSFGKSTSVILPVNALGAPGGESVGIYNSAGERVASLALPAGFGTLVSVIPMHSSSALGQGSGPITFLATDISGTTATLSWSGAGSQGAPVSSGTYSVQVNSSDKGNSFHESRSFSIIKAGDPLDLKPLTKNPLGPADSILSIRYNPPPSGVTRLYLYNGAGELIGQRGDESAAGHAEFDVHGLASGVYICVLLPEGSTQRAVLKIAMLR